MVITRYRSIALTGWHKNAQHRHQVCSVEALGGGGRGSYLQSPSVWPNCVMSRLRQSWILPETSAATLSLAKQFDVKGTAELNTPWHIGRDPQSGQTVWCQGYGRVEYSLRHRQGPSVWPNSVISRVLQSWILPETSAATLSLVKQYSNIHVAHVSFHVFKHSIHIYIHT